MLMRYTLLSLSQELSLSLCCFSHTYTVTLIFRCIATSIALSFLYTYKKEDYLEIIDQAFQSYLLYQVFGNCIG